jgi:acyl-CoA synthetase (AMP-forming)/AMP-acid ligase II
MLYDRWRQIVEERRNEVALTDSASGLKLTFRQLDEATEKGGGSPPLTVFPQGLSSEFILTVLRAWRDGSVVCPLEEGQAPTVFPALPSGCVHIKTTSASTGVPRQILFTAGQMIADADQIVATMGLRRDWPNLGVISLAHSYGFSNLVLPLLLHGIPLLLSGSPLPEAVRRAASLAPDVVIPAVPALWRTWLNADAIPPNLRLAISAGAPLPLALEEEAFKRHALKIHNFYGASECGGIAYDTTALPRADGSCVGSPLQGVQLSVNDGCLRVCSPAVGLTYWPAPAALLGNGCYQTTDLARIDQDFIFLLGRHSDQINIAGRKVSPETIERSLATHPEVLDCIVFGAPGPDHRTETIVACAVTRSPTTAETLKQHLLASLPAWQIPREWWFVPSLEANQRGKLARDVWRQRYLATKRTP